LSGNSQGGEDNGKPGIIGNCHDIYNQPSSGLRLKQTSRGSVKTPPMQINLFSRLKLESAIHAEQAVGFGIRRRWKKWICRN
jgi:hypothetical protein